MPSIDIALQGALLLTLGVVCQWLAWRMRLPAILPLLLVGLLLRPVSGVFDPDLLLGDLLFPFISIGVAIILFDGRLSLKFSEAGNVQRIIRNLTCLGVLVTWGVMGAAAHYIAGLSWSLSLLFGALVSVTGPTVILPMIRSVKPSARIANILRWEGILVDPIGAVLAVLVFEYLITGQQSESLLEFIKVVVIGVAWGWGGGLLLGILLKRQFFPHYLQNFAALAFVLLVFTASNEMGHESGLIAVTVMGVVLANMKNLDVTELLSFKENLTIVLISVFFILLAARLNLDLVLQILSPALLILAVALFICRPLSVLISSIGTSVSLREIALLSWIAPRGIVAAAVSSLFALKLQEKGIAQAEEIVPLTFVLIIGTVVVQSLSAGWLAEKLGLSSRSEQGVLITNANRVSLAIGEALHKNGIKVKLADTRRAGLRDARMKGLEVFYGNPLSEFAERFMDLTGYTHMLATSRNHETNAIMCKRFEHYFGPRQVFSISAGLADDDKESLAGPLKTNMLFGPDASWSKLASLLAQGAVIKSTPLTDEYNFDAHMDRWGKDTIPLFTIDDKNRLLVFSTGRDLKATPGWKLISLVKNGNGNEQQSDSV
ncbi:MAG: sodium:proton antiporter [Gammaproteobacteria bacterium]|nr:sodium:proton antiporter [Gammaproteobacteria bacterium]